MRVSDDRYSRDRLRFDLAMRLIRHEARTLTIRQWTGLSDDRIRKLYRSYVMYEGAPVHRHRGKSPRQAAFFFSNSEINLHAAQLASMYLLHGLLYGSDLGVESRFTVGSLESGAHLCEAYELYIELDVPVHISFEHACFLLQALARREELSVVRCGVCGGVHLRDLLSKRRNRCSTCASPGFAAAEVRMLEPC